MVWVGAESPLWLPLAEACLGGEKPLLLGHCGLVMWALQGALGSPRKRSGKGGT